MAKFSMQPPQINTEDLDNKEAIRRVQSYLYQLNEQLRYMMMNLDGENIQEGSIGETQLSRPVKQNINNIEFKLGAQEQKSKTLADNFGNYYTKIETAAQITTMMDDALGNYYTKTETAAEISTMMGDALGNYYTKSETAAEISTMMGDALGNYYTKSETATEINTLMSNALGNYYTKSETATEINTLMGNALGDYYTKTETANYVGTYVGNAAYGKVSGISITQQGIDMTGSEHINLGSGGLITIGTGFVAGLSRTQIRALDIYSSRMSGYEDVTGVLEDLDWYGWIRNASVSGNTLTLTKSNGGTVSFTPSGGSSYTLPTALQELANVLESVTYANGRLVLYMTGNYSITLYNGTHNAD